MLVDRIDELGVDVSLTRSCLSEMYQDPDFLKLVRDVLSHEENYVLGLGKEMLVAHWLGGFYMSSDGMRPSALATARMSRF